MIFFFDTETTGKAKDFNAPISNKDNWPRLVQLGYLLTEEDGTPVFTCDQMIYPEGFEIPLEATQIHGISTEKAEAYGILLRNSLLMFNEYINKADVIVGHNIAFDIAVVGCEFLRVFGKVPEFLQDPPRIICTMNNSIEFCKLPGKFKGQFKWPKLQELHKELFAGEFDSAHSAFADIQATAKCYFKLVSLGVITEHSKSIKPKL